MQETKKQSQDQIILEYLKKKGKTISTAEAFSLFGIVDLQSVVRNLRKKLHIKDKWVTDKNSFGKPIRYKRYWLGEAV